MAFIMGMKFDTDSLVPDFGSICLISPEGIPVKHYRLRDADTSKLNLITNAADGSDAFTDKGRIFIKLSGVWTEVTSDD